MPASETDRDDTIQWEARNLVGLPLVLLFIAGVSSGGDGEVDRAFSGFVAGGVIAEAAEVPGSWPVVRDGGEDFFEQMGQLLTFVVGERREDLGDGLTAREDDPLSRAASAGGEGESQRAAVRSGVTFHESGGGEPFEEANRPRAGDFEDRREKRHRLVGIFRQGNQGGWGGGGVLQTLFAGCTLGVGHGQRERSHQVQTTIED